MTTDQVNFIASILGLEGSQALIKAVDRCQALESVLIPRSILSWINTTGKIGYEGTVPGVDNSYLAFEKSEEGFTGSVSMGDYMYNFEKSNVFHISSAIALSLGIIPSKEINVKDLDIEKLGKSIDLLVKAKIITNEILAKKPETDLNKDMGDGYGPIRKPSNNNSLHESSKAINWTNHAIAHPNAFNHKTAANAHKVAGEMLGRGATPNHEWSNYHSRMANFHSNQAVRHHELGKDELDKAGPEAASGQVAPLEAAPAMPTAPKAPGSVKRSEKPKLPKIRMSKSEMEHKCGLCNKTSFIEGTFVGCYCLKELAKSTKMVDGYLILGSDWDSDAVLALFESVGRNG